MTPHADSTGVATPPPQTPTSPRLRSAPATLRPTNRTTAAAIMALLSLCLCLLVVPASSAALTTSARIEVSGSQILVDNKPFFVKGVMYSPSPMGSHPQWTWPHGDFFIPQYSNIWQRDFPLLKAMGANTIRISGWNNDLDHGYFLDEAHRWGLKVIVTFHLGNVWQNPVQEEWQMQGHLGRFMAQFEKYLNHPALLAWTFGENLNLPSNGFLQAFSDKHQCGWNGADYNNDKNGCYNNPDPNSPCASSIACVYTHFYSFINLAGAYAKNIMARHAGEGGKPHPAHLVLAPMSDVDVAWMRMNQFGYLAPHIDAWGLQIYRGKDFGSDKDDFLTLYEKGTPYNAQGEPTPTPRPLLVTEYGVDAYNDPCGKGFDTPCYNDVLESPHDGYGEDEDSHAEWGVALAKILTKHSSAKGRGAVAGGTINSWVDEAWRCTSGVGGCGGPVPYPLPGFDEAQCSWKAHVGCPQMNLWKKSLCGYWTPATFDHYSNQGWYGLMRPSPRWGDVDRLTPRLLYGKLQEHWGPGTGGGRVKGNWAWIVLLSVSMFVAAALTLHVQAQYRKRSAQVADLESKSSAMAGSSAAGRSPQLGISSAGAGSPRRSARSGPAGRSSRATTGVSSSSRSPDLGPSAGSTESSPLLGRSAAAEQEAKHAQRS